MHQNEWIHGDLKEANVMVTDDLKTIRLIDFGLTQKTTGNFDISATTFYMHPFLMNLKTKFQIKMVNPFMLDFFSLAVLIGNMNTYIDPEVQIKNRIKESKTLKGDCYIKNEPITKDCNDIKRETIVDILEKANFGKFQNDQKNQPNKETINFRTLVWLMLDFNTNFPLTEEECKGIFSSLIKEFIKKENKKKSFIRKRGGNFGGFSE